MLKLSLSKKISIFLTGLMIFFNSVAAFANEQETFLLKANAGLEAANSKIGSAGYEICVKLPSPIIPDFGEDSIKNDELLKQFYSSLTDFTVKSIELIKSKCPLSQIGLQNSERQFWEVQATKVQDALSNTILQKVAPIKPCFDYQLFAIPSFTTDKNQNSTLYNDYVLAIERQSLRIISRVQNECVSPPPVDYYAVLKELQSNAYLQAKAKYPDFCLPLIAPTAPELTNDPKINDQLVGNFKNALGEWFVAIEKDYLNSCTPKSDPSQNLSPTTFGVIQFSTISTKWDNPSYASGVAQVNVISEKIGEVFGMRFDIKSKPQNSQVFLKIIGSDYKGNAEIAINQSVPELKIIPKLSGSEIFAYIKVQLCDQVNGCEGNLSSLGDYVVTVSVTDHKGVVTRKDFSIVVNNVIPKLAPTNVIVEAPNTVTIDANGYAKFSVSAHALPNDTKLLPSGRFTLDGQIIYKGACGFESGQNVGVVEKIVTTKPGTTYLIIDFNIKVSEVSSISTFGGRICSGQIRFYENGIFDRSDGYFNIQIVPPLNLNSVSIKDISLYQNKLNPGDVATIYYWITKPTFMATNALGAGIGEFGTEIFGDEFSSIGWTLGFVKGESPNNGLYKSNIIIPKSAKPGVFKTYVFWKGVTGPIYGPDLTINSTFIQNDQSDRCQNTITKSSEILNGIRNSVNYWTKIWNDYNSLLEILQAKNLDLLTFLSINQSDISTFTENAKNTQTNLMGVENDCGGFPQIYPKWSETYSLANEVLIEISKYEKSINDNFQRYQISQPKLVPKLGKVSQIVGGCQVEILNYDPSFNWYAKGEMFVDKNGLATILNKFSKQQYISTSKPGYQTVNYLDGIFDCSGLNALTSNTIDAQPPKISVVSVSKTIAYKGQSISVDLLVTDNKEVNNLRVELVDQIGQIKDYYDGVAWPKRISGDSLIGVYRIELWVRTITYDGFWSINASARDLNFNGSTLEEVIKVKIVDGPIPPSNNTNLNTTVTSNTEVSSENPKYVYGKFDVVTSEITKTVVNDVERSKLLSAVTSMVNLPSTVRSNRVLVNKDVARLVDVTVETPKVCSFTSGIINRKIKGLCSLKISTVDSDGNTFAVTKEVRFR